ncbi:MAG TPA: hypothetical protein VFQ53_27590 [Kofleriaceae bacterium]|nr:hypothetical protein [Kofleriaceae bacterium]
MRNVLLAIGIATALVAGCDKQLDRKKLVGKIKDLHALAAETRLLTEQEDRGGVPGPYSRVHRHMLLGKVKDARKDLSQGVRDDSLTSTLRRAQALADSLGPAIRDGANRHQLLEIETDLERLETIEKDPP